MLSISALDGLALQTPLTSSKTHRLDFRLMATVARMGLLAR